MSLSICLHLGISTSILVTDQKLIGATQNSPEMYTTGKYQITADEHMYTIMLCFRRL